VGVQRTFASEHDRGTAEVLLLAPVPRAGIFLAKGLVNFALLSAVGIVAGTGAGLLFNVPLLRWEMPALVLLGAAGLSATGSLYGAAVTNVRARELLVPVLLVPVSLPVLIAGVSATLVSMGAADSRFPWMGLLAAFCVIFVGVGVLLFEYVFED